MDVSLENLRKSLEPKWAHFGRRKNLDISEKAYQMMTSDAFKQTSDGPMSQSWSEEAKILREKGRI